MKTRWYKDAVVYQIYPRSFCDSNGDGIGDLRGIISKLDYIKGLGVDAVWLSPIYKSPNDDNGYDISDYRDIMDEFGTMSDFKELFDGLHSRGIKLIMDLVANHTSDEHYWFSESRKSVDNPYRDYYIWRKGRGKDGRKPPNNWTSSFGGSAWKYDETTKEWYLHLFSRKQPDLNWENPKVRKEIADICNFWMDMGVDGFRCDVITYISKKSGLPDGKFNLIFCGEEQYVVGPRYHEYIKELNAESWSKYDSFTVGEAAGITLSNAYDCIDESVAELDTVFSFEHLCVDMYFMVIPHRFSLTKFKKVLDSWQALPNTCQNTLFLENHDQPRSLGRFTGNYSGHRYEAATALAVAMQLQRGTPFVYQGQEIGMTNCRFTDDEYQDIMFRQIMNIVKYIPFGKSIARYCFSRRARDHARTPMQWNARENAGFSSAKPWMKVNPNYKFINVDKDLAEEKSIYKFYAKLHAYRKGNEAIIDGDYKDICPNNRNIFAYERKCGGKRLLVIVNFKNKAVKFNLPEEYANSKAELELSNYRGGGIFMPNMRLRPYEAAVYSLKSQG
ncbi:MAG: alpha-glucosidase [Clostridia bacterium]|nr:alpha-glucosidase [Clostridia bacterium]